MKTLIAGIDPGATVGWALLNLNGELMAIGSEKGLDLNSLIACLMKQGRVILVGSDKAKLPSFVQESATKLGARVIGPSDDVRVDEKRIMASAFSFNNAHEMDALVASLIAFRKIKPLLCRIRAFLEREKRLGLFESVVELVLKEEISMRAAFVLLTGKDEKKKDEIVVEKQDRDIVQLYSALSRSRKDNAVLLEKNRAFEKRLFALVQELNNLKYRVSTLVKPKTHSEIARIKESQIASLSDRLSNSLRNQEKLGRQVLILEKALFDNNIVAVARFSRLSWDEIVRNKDFLGSCVFVDNCNQMSGKAVDFLKDKGVQVLICRVMPGRAARNALPFACLSAPAVQDAGRFVFLDKLWLEKACSSSSVISQIVEEYRVQRLSGK